MSLSPLWSAAAPSNSGTKSNATVENHMRNIKGDLKKNEKKTIGEFVTLRYASVKRRLARLVF